MKFIQLYHSEIPDYRIQFINSLLKNRIANDYILESTYIPLSVMVDSPIQLFYRSMWCDMYLRRSFHTIYPDIMSHYTRDELYPEDPPQMLSMVYMSISECIQYINEVTPPVMKKDIPENTTSIESIYNLMHFFLFEEKDPSRLAYNTTTFYRIFHMELTPSLWEPNFKKIAFMRNKIKTYDMNYGTMIASIDASSKPLDLIIGYDENDVIQPLHNAYIQMTFHADADDDIWFLFSFLGENHFHICNLYCDENVGFFVSAYANVIDYDTRKFIKSVYSELLQ